MSVSHSPQEAKKERVVVAGVHAAYPEAVVDDAFLDKVVSGSEFMTAGRIAKLKIVSKRTGIRSRPVVLNYDDPFYHRKEPYRVEQLTEIWLEHGIPLCEEACRGAIKDWGGGSVANITHLIASTCTIQSHPGIDAYLARKLGLSPNVSRTLLSGVGCAGAASVLRTAYEFATAATYRGKVARILVVACDLNSLGFRAELQQMKDGHFPIGLTLFSDAAAAAVVSNGIGTDGPEEAQEGNAHPPPFEIRRWEHRTIPDSLDELRLMPTSIGPVSSISKKLPQLIPTAVKTLFLETVSSASDLVGSDGRLYRDPCDFDWALHPGGLGILDQIVEIMGLTQDHITATATTYENWGNSAGPTMLKVLDLQRRLPSWREYVICCGFGNNVDVTMLILRRI